MRKVEILGVIAGIGTTTSFIPQTIRVWQFSPLPAEAVSLSMYIIMTTGICFWAIYGFCIRSPSMVFFNIIGFLISGSILLYKILYG